MIKYALFDKMTNKYLGFTTNSNSPDAEGVTITFEISRYGSGIWLTDTFERAEYIRTNSVAWYNADYDYPMNKINPDHIEVREIKFI